jgi:hypothetical protein
VHSKNYKPSSNRKTTNQSKIFKIGMRTRITFFLLIFGYLIYHWSSYPTIVLTKENIEMLPNFKPGQTVHLYERSSSEDYQRGDILYAKKLNTETFKLFRILAIHNGNIQILKGELFVDDQKMEIEGFTLPFDLNKKFPLLKKSETFMIHDNQATSLKDSLTEGAYKLTELEIQGKVFHQWK